MGGEVVIPYQQQTLPATQLDSGFPKAFWNLNSSKRDLPSSQIASISKTASPHSHKSLCNSSFKFGRVLTKRPKMNQAWSSEKPARFPRRVQEALSESSSDCMAHRAPESGSGPGEATHNIHVGLCHGHRFETNFQGNTVVVLWIYIITKRRHNGSIQATDQPKPK